jgi:hypothetical protein
MQLRNVKKKKKWKRIEIGSVHLSMGGNQETLTKAGHWWSLLKS